MMLTLNHSVQQHVYTFNYMHTICANSFPL